MKRSIKGSQRLPRLIAFEVDGTGTAAIGEGASEAALTDNGTGDWTLTFTVPFLRAPVVTSGCKTATGYVELSVISTTAVRVLGKKTTDNSALDVKFQLHVLGWDTADRTSL